MEEAVENCASMLLSSSLEELIASVDLFGELFEDSTEVWFSRLIQELLAYKRGAIVDHLLQQIITAP